VPAQSDPNLNSNDEWNLPPKILDAMLFDSEFRARFAKIDYEFLVEKLSLRKYTVLWAKKFLEPELRRGYIWSIPLDVDEFFSERVSLGFVTLHCEHIDKANYFVTTTIDVRDALERRRPVKVIMFCSICYKSWLRDLTRIDGIRVVPIYSAKWRRNGRYEYLKVFDVVNTKMIREITERIVDSLHDVFFVKNKSMGWRLTSKDWAYLKIDIWEPEVRQLAEAVMGW